MASEAHPSLPAHDRCQPARPSFVYEREPGAASRPISLRYRRRQPEKTALYAVVRDHLETFLQEGRDADPSGAGYPAFVEHEFRRYLGCAQLARGSARLRCRGTRCAGAARRCNGSMRGRAPRCPLLQGPALPELLVATGRRPGRRPGRPGPAGRPTGRRASRAPARTLRCGPDHPGVCVHTC